MKRLFSFCLIFLAMAFYSSAHASVAPNSFNSTSLESWANSKTIYLVRVTSPKVSQNVFANVNFSVTEVLRGKPCSSLTLLVVFPDDFKSNSEWVLVNTGSDFKDTVGEATEKVCEWLPIGVRHGGKNISVGKIGSIEKIKEYLSQHPYKP